MEDTQKTKKKAYKAKLAEALRQKEELLYELQLLRSERDKAIGEKCLAQAKLKEQTEETISLQADYQSIEKSFISMKIEHVNLKSAHESLKDDHEISKKMLKLRDNEISSLLKTQDPKKKLPPSVPKNNAKEPAKIQMNKNIKPFPSTSFSFNIYSPNRGSLSNSYREEEH